MTTSSQGFQIEMRLTHIPEGGKNPISFLGVGGYKIAPSAITDDSKLQSTRQRVHMIADELINKSRAVLEDNPEHVMIEASQSNMTGDQLRQLADLVTEGKFISKVCAMEGENGARIITFTLTPTEE